jgi:hypothetical protein
VLLVVALGTCRKPYHDFAAINGRVEHSTLSPREGAATTSTVGALIAIVLPHAAGARVLVEPNDISPSRVLDIGKSEVGTIPDRISICNAKSQSKCVDSPAFVKLDLADVP